MLYSTCTFSPEENEGTIAYLLEQFPEFHVVNAIPSEEEQKRLGISYEGFDFGKPEWVEGLPADAPYREELKACIRLWPHKINGEGHFITLLQKGDPIGLSDERCASTSFGKAPLKGLKSISEEAKEFFRELKLDGLNEESFYERLEVREDRIYLMPGGLPDTKGLRILRQGLLLGEMKKQRFEPAQALASSLSTSEYDKQILLSGSSPEAVRYLKCEAIEPEGRINDGWHLVCADGYPMGWGKTAKGSFKNKYLPGWRWM